MIDDQHALSVAWADVGYTYPGEARPALQGLDLRVEAGETVLVMGPSGCGKSTLGLTLNGIIPAMTEGALGGDVRVGELDPQSETLATMAATVGLVFQDPDAQLCTISVRDEITFGPQNLLVDADTISRRLRHLSDLVGMAGHLDANVFELSGGQKQRVGIAGTLATHPRVVLLDEPTANLDPAGRQEVLRVLRTLLSETVMTTLLVEHHPAELLEVCDRVIVMDEGRVVAAGTPRELFAEHGKELNARGIRLPAATLFHLGLSGDDAVPSDLPPTALSVADVDFDALAGPVTHPAVRPPARDTVGHAEPTLEVRNVVFGYRRAEPVLEDLSFQVMSGEIVTLMGANGSGKSTAGSLLVGINRPREGSIRVGGHDTGRLKVSEIAARVGYVFQYPEHQFVSDRVLDEVTTSLQRLGIDWSEQEALAHEQLERFDLAHLADKHPFKLSLGQKRRLSIAAMCVYRPEVLVLDEPTFGQDQAHTDDLVEVVRQMRSEGIAILMITHDLRLAAELADRSIVLSAGTVVFDDAPAQLLHLLHTEGPRWGLWPTDEYAIWHEIAKRRPQTPFTGDMQRLGRELSHARSTF